VAQEIDSEEIARLEREIERLKAENERLRLGGSAAGRQAPSFSGLRNSVVPENGTRHRPTRICQCK
jgi:hypothetical protein